MFKDILGFGKPTSFVAFLHINISVCVYVMESALKTFNIIPIFGRSIYNEMHIDDLSSIGNYLLQEVRETPDNSF